MFAWRFKLPRKSLGRTWADLAEKGGESERTAAKPTVERAWNHCVSFGGFGFAWFVSSVRVRLPAGALQSRKTTGITRLFEMPGTLPHRRFGKVRKLQADIRPAPDSGSTARPVWMRGPCPPGRMPGLGPW